MSDEPTCGKGLAEHSVLPQRLGEVAATMADVLEHHRTSLDSADPDARPEYDAYTTLIANFRAIAVTLEETAARMAGYRDLPMPRHDESALMSTDAVEKFERFVRAERDLLFLMKESVERDEVMLSEMSGGVR
jgi:hypothetical protein